MIDILKSDLSLHEKIFWYDIGVSLSKRIKGVIQLLFNELENSIVIKIFIERFNYTISMSFNRYTLFEHSLLLDKIIKFINYSIEHEIYR